MEVTRRLEVGMRRLPALTTLRRAMAIYSIVGPTGQVAAPDTAAGARARGLLPHPGDDDVAKPDGGGALESGPNDRHQLARGDVHSADLTSATTAGVGRHFSR